MNNYDYKDIASNYDQEVKEYNSYIHDTLFGMCFEFVQSGELLLDLGIGTGLASIHFSKIGLNIYGVDNSEDMLKYCKTKSFTHDLKLHNLLSGKVPYLDHYFNHIICCGVFHFFKDLNNLFKEVSRVIKRDGIFAFTIAVNNDEKKYCKEMTSWNIPIYRHSINYIEELLTRIEMKILKVQYLLLKVEDKQSYNMPFAVLVAKSK
jgi:ubiquinone/menaquinone biosynthesis C-methylase UbiE